MKTNLTKRMAASIAAMTTLCITPAVTSVSSLTSVAANDNIFPYTMFAASSSDGAVTVNAKHFNINGSIASNGTIATPKQSNINGKKSENLGSDMLYVGDKLTDKYFSSAETVSFVNISDHNINLNKALDVSGEASLTGNVNLNGKIKADSDIHISGNCSNANNTVLYSEFGDIIIDSNNVSLTGIIYAPLGDVIINANNINLNNVVIIADTITLNSNNVNANYSSSFAQAVGNESESRDAYIKKYNSWKMNEDINASLDIISQYYNVKPVDAGEYASINLMGMYIFDVKQYEIEGYGNLSIMVTDGAQQMSTIVLTPFCKETPLISTDYMYMGSTRISYIEFYEVCADANDSGYQGVMSDLSTLVDKYSAVPSTTPSPGWYESIRPIGLFKMTDPSYDDLTSAMLADSLNITLSDSKALPELDDTQKAAKKAAVQQYSDNLVDMGGISTDMFKYVMGVDKTKDFFNSVFFGTSKF